MNAIDAIPSNFGNLTNLEVRYKRAVPLPDTKPYPQFFNIACNNLTELPAVLAQMAKLQTIYAHGNSYKSLRLQMWQAQHSSYLPFPNAAQKATSELKEALLSDSISTVSRIADLGDASEFEKSGQDKLDQKPHILSGNVPYSLPKIQKISQDRRF